MSWLVVGIGRRDPQIGCEYELPDDEFDTEAAIGWLGPDARLSRALWPLDRQQLAEAERLVGEHLDADQMNLLIVRKPQWYVTACAAGDEPLVVEYRLPSEFGFTQAAAWIGRWAPDTAYASTPLPAERGAEIEAIFGTRPAPALYRHVLQSTASPVPTSRG